MLIRSDNKEILVISFIILIIVMILLNYFGIKQTEIAYKYANASKVQPTQEIPKQLVAIFVYFLVFLKNAPIISTIFMIIGASLIITAGFILGKRAEQIDV